MHHMTDGALYDGDKLARDEQRLSIEDDAIKSAERASSRFAFGRSPRDLDGELTSMRDAKKMVKKHSRKRREEDEIAGEVLAAVAHSYDSDSDS